MWHPVTQIKGKQVFVNDAQDIGIERGMGIICEMSRDEMRQFHDSQQIGQIKHVKRRLLSRHVALVFERTVRRNLMLMFPHRKGLGKPISEETLYLYTRQNSLCAERIREAEA